LHRSEQFLVNLVDRPVSDKTRLVKDGVESCVEEPPQHWPFYCGERSTAICIVLDQKKSSTYSSEYASGFSGLAASRLAAPHSPRHEGKVG
jgi:hypothetical protein